MEEKERRSGWVNLSFALSVGTKPSIVKFDVEGLASLKGKNSDIEKMLEVNPETQIPLVFNSVYQQVFMAMYLLATLINAPYPPPNLLPAHQQQVPVAPLGESVQPLSASPAPTDSQISPTERASGEEGQSNMGEEGAPQSEPIVETPPGLQQAGTPEPQKKEPSPRI
jgi:hypothetical protein